MREHAVTFDGKKWDDGGYPWFTAPNGPCDAWDDPVVRTLNLMFGARGGKTNFGQCMLIRQCDIDPCYMLYATSTETIALRNVKTKIYPMLTHCQRTEGKLPPRRLRSQFLIRVGAALWQIGWSGSVSTLADLSARVGHASEVDKWESTATTGEADTLQLFLERFKDIPNRKIVIEGTPTIKGQSRIERRIALSDNRHYYVPCPKCGVHQVLQLGRPDEPWGIKWEAADSGKSDPLVAWRTAYYECPHCRAHWLDEHRGRIFRAGVWAAEGQEVQRNGAVVGTARRAGPDAGFTLSSYYSLKLTWGDIAKAFVEAAQGGPRDLQNFMNSWDASTWEELRATVTEEELAERVCRDYPLGKVPEGGAFLTLGVDVQIDHWVYEVWAWGSQSRSWLIEYGTAASWAGIEQLLGQVWPHADGGEGLPIWGAAVDSGYDTKTVYEFCQRWDGAGRPVVPVKGDDGRGATRPWRVSTLRDLPGLTASRSKRQNVVHGLVGNRLLLVNTNYWQRVTQNALDKLHPEDAWGLSLPESAREDYDLLSQLLNEAEFDEFNKKTRQKTRLWKRINESVPNDFRDARRYAHCLADWLVLGAWGRVSRQQALVRAQGAVTAGRQGRAVVNPGQARPDGRPWMG